MNKIKGLVRNLDYYDLSSRLFFACVIAFYVGIFFYIFTENFLIYSLDSASLRASDDAAFQMVMRQFHRVVAAPHFVPHDFKVLLLNGYAYGVIYWFPLELLTLPFYFLSIYCQNDIPLMVFPREVSLIFMLGCAYLIYRIARLYTKNWILLGCILLCLASYPLFGFYALRFSTISEVSFFNLLAIYYVASRNKLDRRDIWIVALICAVAVGIKMSGALIAPVVGLLIWDRLGRPCKLTKPLIDAAMHFALVFFPALLFFISPAFLWRQDIFLPIFDMMQKTTIDSEGTYSISRNFHKGFLSASLASPYFMILLGWFALVAAWKVVQRGYQARRYDFLYMAIGIVIAVIYVTLHIKMGEEYSQNYLFVFTLMTALGLLALDTLPRPIAIFAAIFFLGANFYFKNSDIFTLYSRYYQVQTSAETREWLEGQAAIKNIVGPVEAYKPDFYQLRDYEAPAAYTAFRSNVIDLNIFDNMPTVMIADRAPDLIVLYKQSHALMNDREYKSFVDRLDAPLAKAQNDNRALVRKLLSTHVLLNKKYKVVLESKNFIYLKAI